MLMNIDISINQAKRQRKRRRSRIKVGTRFPLFFRATLGKTLPKFVSCLLLSSNDNVRTLVPGHVYPMYTVQDKR